MSRLLLSFAFLLVACVVPRLAAAACTITVSPIVFGRYDVFDASPLDSVGEISYQCDQAVPRLRISFARPAGGSARSRALRNGEHRLVYQLYVDPAKTRIWGDGSEATETLFVDTPSTRKTVTRPIYARIPPRQNVAAGTYVDQITVRVEF